MFTVFSRWYQERFSDPQAVTLMAILVGLALVIYFAAGLLAPLLVALVLAFLLEWPVAQMLKLGINRTAGASLVIVLFLGIVVLLTFGLIPSVWRQGVSLIADLPSMIDKGLLTIQTLINQYPRFINPEQLDLMVGELKKLLDTQHVLDIAKQLIGYSASLLVLMVYAILVPLLVFFFLKDKELFLSWFVQFLPSERHLTVRVWEEIDDQIGNYVHGKFAEVFILWFISFATFAALDLNYAMLLALLMGIQAIIPYIGATLVTFPVLGVAYFQWGLIGDDFMYVLIAYSIIQALDGVMLVPLLFSEAVNLHAVAIIIAILFFGGLWGFWGVFLAIPLATVVKAVLTSWPRMGTNISLNSNY